MSKPAFDPNKPFDAPEANAKPKFDPNQDFTPGHEEEKPSRAGEAALQGFGNGLTMGYAPHLQAAAEKPLAKLYDLVTGEHVSDDIPDNYVDRRDEFIKRQEGLAKDHPVAYNGASVAGALTGGAAVPFGAAAKGATLATKVALGAGTGAALGAIQNPGDVEGKVDPVQFIDRAKNAGIGAGVGAFIPLAGTAAQKAAAYLRGKAKEKAFKALGPYARDAMKAYDKGQIQETGGVLLDEGVVGGMPTSYQGLAKRADAALEGKGQQIGDYIDTLDGELQRMNAGEPGLISPGAPPPQMRAGISRQDIANAVKDDLTSAHTDIPGVAQQNSRVNSMASQFAEGGDPLLGLKDAQAKKLALKKQINWDRLPGADIPLEEQVNRSLYNKVSTGLEDAAQTIDNSMNGSVGKYKDLKQEYGALSRASEIANKRESKEFANRFLSPTDYLSAGVGAAGGFSQGKTWQERLGNAALGATVGLAHKGVRQYGNQVMAPALNNVAKGLMQIPRFADLASRNPVAFQRMVEDLANKPGFQRAPPTESSKPEFVSKQMPDEVGHQRFIEGN